MDNKSRRQKEHRKGQWELIIFIVALVLIFAFMIIKDKRFPKKLERKRYEGVVPTYDGSLHRNLSNPLGFE